MDDVYVEELEDGEFAYNGVPYVRIAAYCWETYGEDIADSAVAASLEDAYNNSFQDVRQ